MSINLWRARVFQLFAIPFLVRLILFLAVLQHRPDILVWGINEPGQIAKSIVTHGSFESPFHDATGPTAWFAPLYPALLALIFLIAGVQTSAAAVIAIIVNISLAAATCVIIWKLGHRILGESVGWWAALLFAISPPLLVVPMIMWDSCLTAFLASMALLLTFGVKSQSSSIAWLLCGVLWGLAGLSSPSVLAPVPLLLLWLYWAQSRKLSRVALLTLGLIITILPWTVRNAIRFHQFIPIRSNGWAEIYFGNLGFETHPLGETRRYQRVGEIQFVNEAKRDAIGFIGNHPREFARRSARRFIDFWAAPGGPGSISFFVGMFAIIGALGCRSMRRLPVLLILLSFPLVYYASYAFGRYRYPIDPVIYLSATYGLLRLVRLIPVPLRKLM